MAFPAGRPAVKVEKKTEWRSAFDRYWRHVVLSVVDGRATLWYNGESVGQAEMPKIETAGASRLALASFTRAEPLMKLEDLIHRVRVYDRALEASAVRARFEELSSGVHRGLVYPGTFHFNAGPIISHVTTGSATLVFETDRPTTAVVEYGSRLPGDRKKVDADPRTIHQVQLTALAPASLYYYRVTVRDTEGKEITSGDLTLRTASPRGEPITFAVLGDTEARPHVNDRIAKLIWDQRPHFAINLGDLTDGGTKSRKPDWNLEYFLAFTQLHSRVPVFAVPGNGEWGDRELYWYQQYMAAPVDQGNAPGYYAFSFGDADFFMLDSNPRETDFKPGGAQYQWLEQQLSRSTARWKFVCHHHPVYTSSARGSFSGKTAPPVDEAALPVTALYDRYGVDMAFAGHIHHYERSYPVKAGRLGPDGVVYVTSGGGGGNLQDFTPVRSWFTAMSHRGYHYCTISIDGGRLELRMYDSEGSLRDRLELRKQEPGHED
ncbi:MAG: metallophosphoesterase family protein [Candidatus Solibacter sp.]|nr:metallophosphoesterase family protein [Candidatus Solibacter sp.]